jgi:NIPSNAP protein
MPYVIDTIEVEPAHVAPYLEAVEHLGIPVMTEAGASFVSCATTSSDIGENVAVQIVWGFENHDEWNLIRRNMVLDRRWYEYGRTTATLRRGGTRRIYHRVDFSPS